MEARLYCRATMPSMTRRGGGGISPAIIALAATVLHAQAVDIDAHIAAAKAAAKTDHGVLFTSLCSAEPTGPGTGRRGAGAGQPTGTPPGPPAKESWHAEPMQGFD